MEQTVGFYRFMVTLLLQTGFVKNGSIRFQRDEKGRPTAYRIPEEAQCDSTAAVCPYCEGTDNIHLMKDTGRALVTTNAETGEVEEQEVNGFRCTTCFKLWVMFVSNKGRCTSIGVN